MTDTQQLQRRRVDQIGQVSSDPLIVSGKLTIAGTRIMTPLVWEFHKAGDDDARSNEEYSHLHPEDIRAAIACEQMNRRKGAA